MLQQIQHWNLWKTSVIQAMKQSEDCHNLIIEHEKDKTLYMLVSAIEICLKILIIIGIKCIDFKENIKVF